MPKGVYERTSEMKTGKYKRTSEMKTGKYKRTPEHCAAVSKALTGVPRTQETCAAISAAKKGVPRTPKHNAAIVKGREESGADEAMRGGHDIVKHHNIYDHNDLSKYTIEMTRSEHTSLHHNMQTLGLKVPHINTGHENEEELQLMEYLKKIESEPKSL